MPNFDGTGPLKRGRVIGRGLGACRKGTKTAHRMQRREPWPRNETADK